jgi:hypothetical protein
MAPEDLTARYNYDEFVREKFEPWMNFHASPSLGEVGPDFALWDLDGEPTTLHAVLADSRYVVVEFGSFT